MLLNAQDKIGGDLFFEVWQINKVFIIQQSFSAFLGYSVYQDTIHIRKVVVYLHACTL